MIGVSVLLHLVAFFLRICCFLCCWRFSLISLSAPRPVLLLPCVAAALERVTRILAFSVTCMLPICATKIIIYEFHGYSEKQNFDDPLYSIIILFNYSIQIIADQNHQIFSISDFAIRSQWSLVLNSAGTGLDK